MTNKNLNEGKIGRRINQILAVFGLALLVIAIRAQTVRAVHVTIDTNLDVTPSEISYETVFPEEVLFRPLDVSLSSSFIGTSIYDDVEYHIEQKVKPHDPIDSNYCQLNPTDYSKCFPSLCPYLSKTPDGTPDNDTGVPAFHDPTASSSIAYGRLAKSDNDLEDNWVIDFHVPCFRGECAQDNVVPPEYEADPSLQGEVFGCDLKIVVDHISFSQTITRTLGFWQTHTAFTSSIFAANFPSGMTVGAGSHTRLITNNTGNGQSRLFGAYYSSIPKKTNNSNRTALDKARMQLLQQLVTAKINCAAFGCTGTTNTLISDADAAYAGNDASAILTSAGALDSFNNSGDALAIPSALGNTGSATPHDSQNRANKVFWDSP